MTEKLFPELEKLAEKSSELETIQGFLEFTQKKRIEFGSWENDTFEPHPVNISDLIYEYLGVDMNTVEKERRKILEQLP